MIATLLLSISLFTPPSDWKCADPKESGRVGFVGAKSGAIAPSINMTEEEVTCDLDSYVEAVLARHRSHPKRRARDLGSFTCEMGKAHLVQIDADESIASLRLLQLIALEEGRATILTTTCEKAHFVQVQSTLRQSLSSLRRTDNLLSELTPEERIDALSMLNSPPNLKRIAKRFPKMGAYWHILFAKKIEESYSRVKKDFS